MGFKIIQEGKFDFKKVCRINKLAFEDESEVKFVELFLNSNAFVPELSLVAIINYNIIGHILFVKIKIVDSNQNKF